ncbi:Cytochrome P450 81D1 [Apostasia shenzhenica]|uniref:Cytochrome P450 81D1 n=1 Tax=Apostasia shenzhenica TaxID=1088818 RepID=A0A2I0ADM8_9ASPA|nr:Cytochrome P450 81D1 [Apostasia shenzhenica]
MLSSVLCLQHTERKAMEMESFCTSAAIIVVVMIVFHHIRRHRHGRLKLPPTIPGAFPIIGHLHLLRRRHQPMHRTLAEISASHGPLLLLHFGCRPVLLVTSPSAAEECLSTNDVTFAGRPSLLYHKYLSFNNSTLSSASYGPLWRNLRRIATVEVLSSSRIQSFAGVRREEICAILRSLFQSTTSAEAGEWHHVEMKSKLKQLSFNTMMRMIDGRKYYGEKETVEPEEGRRFRGFIEEVFRLSGASNLQDFVPMTGWLGKTKNTMRMVTLGKEMEEVFQEIVDQRRKRRSAEMTPEMEKKTILDVMLDLQEANPEIYTDTVIKGLIWVLVAAGTDTSGGTIEWALSLLLNHPESLKKARSEIDLQVGYGRLISDADIRHLPYLNSVIKETLRLFPAGPLLAPHQSTADCTVHGYDVPKGTMLLVNAFAMHRDPTLWEDAGSFKPERFAGAGDGEHEGFKFLPFGSGRRRCPGEAMAIQMVSLGLGALIQCFEWERKGEEAVDLRPGIGITSPKLVPLEAKIKPRRRYAAFQLFKRFKRRRLANRETRPSFSARGITEVRRFRTERRARLHLLMSSRQWFLRDLCASSIRPIAKTLDLFAPESQPPT